MQVVQRRMSKHKTAEGLGVCVLGEAKTSQEGAIQVAAKHAEQVVKDQDCGTTNDMW